MEKEGLVSLITPCHNSSMFIHRLLDSVLEQTYEKIEMITVDNGSTDNTADIIKNYIPKFDEKGYSLIYIHQDNLGPSAGIQTGLRVIRGEYLLMPDSDDWYAGPKSIEKFVKKFKELTDEYAIVRCQQNFVDEETMKTTCTSYQNVTEEDPGTIFEDCLFAKKGYIFAPISYMIKVSALREETRLEIYSAFNTGQHRQICLPLYYKYKTWTILEPLVCYLVRKSSVSHGDYSKYPTQLKLYKNSPKYIDSIFACIDTMPKDDKEYYRNAFMRMNSMRICLMAKRYGENEDLRCLIGDYKRFGGSMLYIKFLFLKITIKNTIIKLMKGR